MNAIIYYFSGTGNSYKVAKDISKKLNTKAIAIPQKINEKKIKISSEVIGFVFPDYHSNVPNIVRKFIEKIESFKNKYIFAVFTYGGKPGPTVKYLEKIIASGGGKLSGGFGVKMPYNYIIPSFSFRKFSFLIRLKTISEIQQKRMFFDCKKKLDRICDYVKTRKEGFFEKESELLFKFIDAIKIKESFGKYTWLKFAGYKKKTDLSFSESRQLMDHGFYADEKCIGCGTCKRICPVSNIDLIGKKPSWNRRCEQCFACLQWCPKTAIQFGKDMKNDKRYHHPDVKAEDLMMK